MGCRQIAVMGARTVVVDVEDKRSAKVYCHLSLVGALVCDGVKWRGHLPNCSAATGEYIVDIAA